MSSIQEFHPQRSDKSCAPRDYEQIESRSDKCHWKQSDRNIVSPDGKARRNDNDDRSANPLESAERLGARIPFKRIHQYRSCYRRLLTRRIPRNASRDKKYYKYGAIPHSDKPRPALSEKETKYLDSPGADNDYCGDEE